MIIILLLAIIQAQALVQAQEWVSPAHQAAANFAATYKSRAQTYNLTVASWMIENDFEFKFSNGTRKSKWQYINSLQNHEHFPRGIYSAQLREKDGADIGADLIAKHIVSATLYTYFFRKYSNLPGEYMLMRAEKTILNALHHAVIFEDELEKLVHGGVEAVEVLRKYFTEDFEFVNLDGKKYQALPFISRFLKEHPNNYFNNPKNAKSDANRNLIVTHVIDHHDFVFVYVPAPQLAAKYQIKKISAAENQFDLFF
ncbi:unnamed protein product [Caenorhabditis angaria]|uniref:Glycosyltransferase family 92 protein n=1 Tax=Caenorhabditis angaria TaxID=860376 RepID=A0A9P1IFN1_9PELO|nr:unnamed protein product [Caenorhabditis angaria]